MCEHCGCREVPSISELMDEHTALSNEAHYIREALSADDRDVAASLLATLVDHLDRHVRREEAGIFSALKSQGEFLDEVADLEGEHRDFDATIADLDPGSVEFPDRVLRMLDDLDLHVEREDLGIFPVSVVSLGVSGWQTVDDAHLDSPSFLFDPGR